MTGHRAALLAVAALLLLAASLRARGAPIVRGARQPRTDTSLGVARAGAHACRVGDVACVDAAASLALAAALARVSRGPTTAWLVLVLVVGEAQHWAYGVPTATQRWLFGYS